MTNEIETLIRQVGRGTFAMLGASQIVAEEKALRFRIRGCRAGNMLRITLRPDDTYDVELLKVRGLDVREVASVEMVYVDSLHATIERLTGLRTRL